MQIFIMRHGEASNQCLDLNKSDDLRPLTVLGNVEAKKMGCWLAQTAVAPIEIFASPYLRAQQTCDQVVNSLTQSKYSLSTQPVILDIITPSGNAQQVHDFIDGLCTENMNEKKTLLLVSHMPFISYLVAQLTQSQNMPIFTTGAIAQINYDRQLMHGELLNLITPDKV